MEILKELKKIALFKGFEDKELLSMMNCFSVELKEYEKNQTIIEQGQKVEKVVLLLRGEANVENIDIFDNQSIILNLKNGDFFGLEETYTDKIYLDFGADHKLEGTEYKEEVSKMKEKAKKQGIDLISIPIRHLGTEKAHELYKKLEDYLAQNGIEMKFETIVQDLIIENNKVKGVKIKPARFVEDEEYSDFEEVYGDKVVIAVRKKRRKLASWYVWKT